MSGLNVCFYGNPCLEQQSSAVNHIDDEILVLARNMIETMYAVGFARSATGVGLAGPQVGIQKRLFVFDARDGRGARTIINPVIHSRWGICNLDEACPSLPGLNLAIERASNIHLSGRDLGGNEIDVVENGVTARIIQHEVDHLDGHLMMDRVDSYAAANARDELRSYMSSKSELMYS